jgi:hypothetical protein
MHRVTEGQRRLIVGRGHAVGKDDDHLLDGTGAAHARRVTSAARRTRIERAETVGIAQRELEESVAGEEQITLGLRCARERDVERITGGRR